MNAQPFTPVPNELLDRLARGELNVTQYAIAGWLIHRRWRDGGAAAAFTLEELRHAIGYQAKPERLRRHLVGLGYGTLEPARGSRRYWRWTTAVENPGSPSGSPLDPRAKGEPGSPLGADLAPPSTDDRDDQTLPESGDAEHAGSPLNGRVAPPGGAPQEEEEEALKKGAVGRAREDEQRTDHDQNDDDLEPAFTTPAQRLAIAKRADAARGATT